MVKNMVMFQSFHVAGTGWHKMGVKAESITPTAKSGESGSRAATTAQQEGRRLS
jgi:hypothetical protein